MIDFAIEENYQEETPMHAEHLNKTDLTRRPQFGPFRIRPNTLDINAAQRHSLHIIVHVRSFWWHEFI